MKIVFLSNYFNHHQKPFSDEMYALIGDDYSFVETIPMEEERVALGWQMKSLPSYVHQSYLEKGIQNKINEADVVIAGSAPENLLKYRKKNNKLILRYSERPLKKIPSLLWLVKKMIRYKVNNPFGKPIYMLCASAYTAFDLKFLLAFWGKTYKWGYFPAKRDYENIEDLINSKQRGSILWVARYIDWKHPEIMTRLAEKLIDSNLYFHITMIGNGCLQNELMEDVKNKQLSEYFTFYGSMSPELVRNYMEKSEIFISTSDRNEGWGAVINESMNSCCAVVANKDIGSAPFLIRNGVNGFVYDSFDVLMSKVKMLLVNKNIRQSISKSAYETISNLWNPQKAASNCLVLCESLLKGKKCVSITEGPCSKC